MPGRKIALAVYAIVGFQPVQYGLNEYEVLCSVSWMGMRAQQPATKIPPAIEVMPL